MHGDPTRHHADESTHLPDDTAGLEAACLALDRNATTLAGSCREIRDTLASLDAALGGISHVGGAPGDYGIIGLPIQAAIKAARGVATQVVRQQTGTSLDEWTKIVASTVEAFDDYVDCLTATSATLRDVRSDESATTATLAASLQELEWRTREWRPVLVNLGQVGELLDAVRIGITRGTPDDAAQVEQAPTQQIPAPQATTEKLKTGFKKATTKATGAVTSAVSTVVAKPNPWQDVLLAPFVDVAERVQGLPTTVQVVSEDVQMLEVLIDVAQAQVAVALGASSREEAQLVAVRAHAVVDIPHVVRAIEGAREEIATTEATIARLAGAVDAGRIDPSTATELDAEYRESLAESHARLQQYEHRLAVWRREGSVRLHACIDAATARLRVLNARGIAEDTDEYDDRVRLLRREIAMANKAAAHLAEG